MFRGIVQASFGMGEVALVEKALTQLAISHRQPFFISDNSMAVEGLFERRDSLLPLSLTGFLKGQVIVENAECAVVFEVTQQIQGFKVVGAGFFRMVGADVQIAEIHQGVGDGMLVPFCALNGEHFPVAGFCLIQVTRLCTDVTQIAKRIGEGAVVIGEAIIRDRLLIGGSGLRELAAVEKNACTMFVVVRHFFVKRSS